MCSYIAMQQYLPLLSYTLNMAQMVKAYAACVFIIIKIYIN